MRVWESWPLGGGRRMGVSLGPVGLLAFALFVMPFVLIGWLLCALVQIGVWAWHEYRLHRAARS